MRLQRRRTLKYCMFAIVFASVYVFGRGMFQHGRIVAPPLGRQEELDDGGWNQMSDSFGKEDMQQEGGETLPKFADVVGDIVPGHAEELEIKPNVLDEHMGLLREMKDTKPVQQRGQDIDENFADEQFLLPNNPPKNRPNDKAKDNDRKKKDAIESTHHLPPPKRTSSHGVPQNATKIEDNKKDEINQDHLPHLHRPPDDLAAATILPDKANEFTTRAPKLIVIDPDKFNITKELPEKIFDPAHPLGEMGKPVIFEGEMEKHAKALYHKNAFNLLASDMIAFNRSLPDVRPEQCKSVVYPTVLPTTSVIIIFHNEAFTTLIRTVHSVINRSPRHLLKEIILVDDASTQDHLKSKLDDYISRHFQSSAPVRIERLPSRSGLIRARMQGAQAATGTVLTYLDSHCEVIVGWLEPLLAVIAKNRRNVVTPTIDVIDDNDLSYHGTSNLPQVGSFSWSMVFRWISIQTIIDMESAKKDPTLPIRSPTMAGGLFAIDRSYFMELGLYDPGFQIWGAENLELSFKIWMCGGSLYVMACSHVGHIFRKYAPYSGMGGFFHRNTKRLVEVWLDDARSFYYKMNPEVLRVDAGDLQEQIDLREKLKCKSFDWYLENVFPESSWPRNGSIFGLIRNPDFNMCLETTVDKNVVTKTCGPVKSRKVWEYTHLGEVKQDQQCLDYTGQGSKASMFRCHKAKGNQFWKWNNSTKQIAHVVHNACLGIRFADNGSPSLEMAPCLESNHNQRWEMPPRYNSKMWS